MTAVPTFRCVALDCPDPRRLAEFYAALLDWPEPESEEGGEWVTVTGPNGVQLAFQRVANYRAPEWPGQDVPQQLHLDLAVADLDAGEERAVKLGAKLLDKKPSTFRVFADPIGHPFCLCAC
ncbi:VOC family protein [Amycolatopsis acidicola]|uniref:VOC family protein n=1 Tax=Amycolatopsis acidicola TaxID=2596893 RepID=A0A5N0VGY1_9PSEU|nr:VOC family protein [Amycolatopsis acidicola]KAA9164908.1 VOC family protein [Amycolatopsis acidicola]